jgi:hypothetical protein
MLCFEELNVLSGGARVFSWGLGSFRDVISFYLNKKTCLTVIKNKLYKKSGFVS